MVTTPRTSITAHSPVADLPDDWEWSKFGYHFTESDERNGENPPGPLLSVSEYRGVELNTRTDGQKASEDVSHYRVVRPGQLAANMMWLNHGGLGVSTLTGHISPAYKAFWISGTLNPRFAHHMLRSSRYVNYFSAIGTGVRPNSQMVTKTVLDMMPIPLPSAETQRAIADYLDRETGEIDAMIAKMDELSETLELRRRTFIEDLFASLKSAKVALHHVVKFRSGQDYKSVSDESGDVPVYGSGGIFATANEYLYNGESVLFGRKGTVDRPLHVNGRFWTIDTMFYTELSEGICGRWLYYWATTIPFPLYSTDTALPSMTSSTLGRLKLPLIDPTEQRGIADYLDEVTSKIDAMLAKVAELKSLLIERRAALITEVVTGRKKVA